MELILNKLSSNFLSSSVIAIMGLAVFSNMSVLAATTTANKVSTTLKKSSNSTVQESNLSGDFGIQTNRLIDDVGEVVGNDHFGELNIKYNSLSEGNSSKRFDLSARMNNEEELMFSLKEVILEYKYSSSKLAIGRAIMDWSPTDAAWGLGKVNNRENFDYFEPDQEGLIGVFYDKSWDNGVKVSLFGSMIYVPELNPGTTVDESTGKVICKNPWCSAPAESVPVDGKDVPIKYTVNFPEMADVLFKYSVGAKIGFSKPESSISWNAFYMKKPENSISVIADVNAESDLSQINAEVTPQFYYHDVVGGDMGYKINENLDLYGGAISSIPNKSPEGKTPYIEQIGIKPKKIKEDYLSTGAKYGDGDAKVHLGYIARVSDFDRDNEILAEYPRWNQAVNFAYSKRITSKVDIMLDYKFDMLTEDRLTMFKTNYRFGPNVTAAAGINIVGTNPEEKSYWSQFENNDSVFSSLKYTF